MSLFSQATVEPTGNSSRSTTPGPTIIGALSSNPTPAPDFGTGSTIPPHLEFKDFDDEVPESWDVSDGKGGIKKVIVGPHGETDQEMSEALQQSSSSSPFTEPIPSKDKGKGKAKEHARRNPIAVEGGGAGGREITTEVAQEMKRYSDIVRNKNGTVLNAITSCNLNDRQIYSMRWNDTFEEIHFWMDDARTNLGIIPRGILFSTKPKLNQASESWLTRAFVKRMWCAGLWRDNRKPVDLKQGHNFTFEWCADYGTLPGFPSRDAPIKGLETGLKNNIAYFTTHDEVPFATPFLHWCQAALSILNRFNDKGLQRVQMGLFLFYAAYRSNNMATLSNSMGRFWWRIGVHWGSKLNMQEFMLTNASWAGMTKGGQPIDSSEPPADHDLIGRLAIEDLVIAGGVGGSSREEAIAWVLGLVATNMTSANSLEQQVIYAKKCIVEFIERKKKDEKRLAALTRENENLRARLASASSATRGLATAVVTLQSQSDEQASIHPDQDEGPADAEDEDEDADSPPELQNDEPDSPSWGSSLWKAISAPFSLSFYSRLYKSLISPFKRIRSAFERFKARRQASQPGHVSSDGGLSATIVETPQPSTSSAVMQPEASGSNPSDGLSSWS